MVNVTSQRDIQHDRIFKFNYWKRVCSFVRKIWTGNYVCRKPDKFQNSVGRRFAFTCIKMTELYDIFSPSFAQLVSVLSYQKIQNWPLVEFSFNLSKYLKILLPIPLFAHKVSQTLDHNNKMTQLFRYFCGYSRNCWNYFGSTRYFGLGTYIKTRFFVFKWYFAWSLFLDHIRYWSTTNKNRIPRNLSFFYGLFTKLPLNY